MFSVIILLYTSMKIFLILCCFEDLISYSLDELIAFWRSVYFFCIVYICCTAEWMLVVLLHFRDYSAQISIKSANFSLWLYINIFFFNPGLNCVIKPFLIKNAYCLVWKRNPFQIMATYLKMWAKYNTLQNVRHVTG